MRKQRVLYPDLSYRIVGCAMQVHKSLGPGFDEPHYHLALRNMLRSEGLQVDYKPQCRLIHRGIPFEEDPPVELSFDGKLLGTCEAHGFRIAGVGFVKVVALQNEFQASEIAIVRTYLRHMNLRWGLSVNFGKRRLEVYGVHCP